MEDILALLIENALGTFDSILEEAAGVLSLGNGNWDKMLVFAEILKPFAYTIIGICLLVEMIQTFMKFENFRWESALRLGIKMVMSKVFVDISPTFLKACFLQATDWLDRFSIVNIMGSESTEKTANNAADLLNQLMKDTATSASLPFWGTFLVILLLVFLIWISSLVIKAIAFGRIFEIYILLALSPIPVAFMPSGHGDGIGISPITTGFLKSFISACLQGLVIVLDLQIFKLLLGDIIRQIPTARGELIGYLCAILLAAITLIIVVVKSGSMSKRLIGSM